LREERQMQVDINCDMGESFGPYTLGSDEEMMKHISSANIACGFHGGDPIVMDRTVKMAVERGVQVGCHPGYPDLMGFGRRVMACSPEEIESYVLYQLGALWAFTRAHGTELRHFKAHGALSNVAMRDMDVARAIARAVARFSKEIVLVSSVGSRQVEATEEMGLRPAINVSTDRAFNTDGTPVSRKTPGAVIHDPKVIVERAVQMVRDGTVTAITGETVKIRVDTIAIHGDNPGAVRAAVDMVQALKAAGVQVKPLAEIL
jgi:5-oxoprolinase (ATP-hydrolysing) subunit A